MRFADFLQEQKEKRAVLAFGRMNPITRGHEQLINKVKDVAKEVGGSHHIVLSHSHDTKKNPLFPAQKIKHAKRAFPGMNFSTSSTKSPSLLTQATDLHKKGVTHLDFVCGSDRVKEFNDLLHRYNGQGKEKLFNFKKITVHSAGERDPDSEGVSGISGTKMRDYASKGNFKDFRKNVPSNMSDAHAKEMYHDVRKGMGMKEDIDQEFEKLLVEGVHRSNSKMLEQDRVYLAAVKKGDMKAVQRMVDEVANPDLLLGKRFVGFRSEGKNIFLRVTSERDKIIVGIEVDKQGDEIVPKGKDKEGRAYTDRTRVVEKAGIGKISEYRISKKYGTLSLFVPSPNPVTHNKLGDVIPLSQRFNESYRDTLFAEGVHDKGIFKAVFIAGGPGSGKDYVLDKTLSGLGLTELSSDKALEYLMDKEGLDKRMPASEEERKNIVRSRAKNINELRQRLAVLGRNGLIVNETGADHKKIARIKERLEEIGYDTSMIMVNTKDEISQHRNIERGQRGGRTVPEHIRKSKWDSVQSSRPEFAKMFGSKYVEFDNSEDLRPGKSSPEIVKAKNEEILSLFKNFQKFTSEPPKSEAATAWVASELDKKDTLPIPKNGAEMVPHHDSSAAQEASKMGLQYYGFGRFGKNGKVTHRSVHDKLIEIRKGEHKQPKIPVLGSSTQTKNVNEEFEKFLSEDLRKWFSKTDPEGGWKRINSKGEAIGPCAREPGEPKPKCMSNEKIASLSKKERASAVRAKRKHDPNPERKGKPINVSSFGKGKLSEEKKKTPNLFKDKSGKVRTFILRRAAAKEAHIKNGTVIRYKNNYAIQTNEENENVSITNELTENQTEGRKTFATFRRTNDNSTRERGDLQSESVTELAIGSEHARGGIIFSEKTTQETGRTTITLKKTKATQEEKIDESIDKGIEPGLSMATSGENLTRSSNIKNKLIKKPFEETIGAGGEDVNSIASKKEDEMKKVGISLQTFKAKRPIG